MSRFDWYGATVERHPVELRHDLERAASAAGGQVRWMEGKPMSGYGHCERMLLEGQPILDVMHSGYNPWPHVIARGSAAHEAVPLIREVAPVHFVARADVCDDFVAPGCFEMFFEGMRDLARELNISTARKGDWDSEQTSRTFQMGSRNSVAMARNYEKGKQLRKEYPGAADQFPEDWARLELEVKPSKREHKQLLATIEADEFWGCSRWSKRLAEQLLALDVPRYEVGTVRKYLQDMERAEFHFFQQYGNLMRQLRRVHGSWARFGEYCGERLEPEVPQLDWSVLDGR